MSQNIDISLITNQTINKKDIFKKKEESQSKIVLYDFFSMNEINISKKIKKIAYFANYFDIVKDYNYINISDVSDKIIETEEIDEKYVICHYNNDKRIVFQNFLLKLPDIKQFILNILNSYSNLLISLNKLNDNNICFFDLKTENIVFSKDFKPFLKDFKNSLLIFNINETYFKNIVKNVENYTYKPLEVHVLFYLIANNEETLSLSFIELICSNFVKNMNVLLLFSQSYRESYEKICVETLKKYINKSKSTIINDIIKYNKYWDNYSISILYLHIIGNITRVFSLRDTFMNKFTTILTKNIHPNPLKRETLDETIKNYDQLFYDFTDWSFINSISKEKIKNLYSFLFN